MEVTMTKEQLDGILKLIGETSIVGRVDLGLTQEESESLWRFYREHKKIGEI